MEKFDLYRDIASRTGGDIYIGVVGPVRTGKSTFIKKFMEALVLPKIDDPNRKMRVVDELPQSADGKTIMTTQPKFVPDQAVRVDLQEGLGVNVRLIDCVGYIVEDAVGYTEGEKSRQVRTPWSDEEMSFEEAAEFGTRKVINDHSTIGIIVTTDGSVTGIGRDGYRDPERRVIEEMSALGKPFVILLNTKYPDNTDVKREAQEMEKQYGVPVLVKNVATMVSEDISDILSSILMEFPLKRVDFELPKWLRALPNDNAIIADVLSRVRGGVCNACKMSDYKSMSGIFDGDEYIAGITETDISFGEGVIKIGLKPVESLFYSVLSGRCGCDIKDDFELISYIKDLSHAKREYDKLSAALEEVEVAGYGVVAPDMTDMDLQSPQVVKKNGRYAVKLKASAPTLHIMRVDVETEVSPMFGGDGDSEDTVKSWLGEFGEEGEGIWETNMFGKTLSTLAKEGLENKIRTMPTDARVKLRKTLGRIVNEGKGGVLCILL